jgi:hypothetical protein
MRCVAFMALFVMLGGGVFHVWEGWDLVAASYFSYVTLTTIGGWLPSIGHKQ